MNDIIKGPERQIMDLRARVEELEEALKEMELDMRGMIYEKYKGTLHYPDQQRRYKRDLGICDRAAALLHPTATEKG